MKIIVDLSCTDLNDVIAEGMESIIFRPLSQRESDHIDSISMPMMNAIILDLLRQMKKEKITLQDRILVVGKPSNVLIAVTVALKVLFVDIDLWTVETDKNRKQFLDLGGFEIIGREFEFQDKEVMPTEIESK